MTADLETELRARIQRLEDDVHHWKQRATHCEANLDQARDFAIEAHKKYEGARAELIHLRGRWGSGG